MSTTAPGKALSRHQRLRRAVEHASHYLPQQGPIGVFVHHNTLHAFQYLPFHEAVAQASEVFGAQPYLAEDVYRRHFARGRIRSVDLDFALAERWATEPGDPRVGAFSQRETERISLLHGLGPETEAGLRWQLGEREASRHFLKDIPNSTREALLASTAQAVRAQLERLGTEATFAELVHALTSRDAVGTVRAEAMSETHRHAPPADTQLLRTLGVPVATSASYLACVDRLLGADATPLRRSRWLEAEVTRVAEPLAHALRIRVGADGLRAGLKAHPEALAIGLLWMSCRALPIAGGPTEEKSVLDRVGHDRSHRELLWIATGEDPAELVDATVTRICAAFLDEGMAHWPMPDRSLGLYRAWRALVLDMVGPLPAWLDGLRDELATAESRATGPEDVVLAFLDELGVRERDWDEYLQRVLLQLPGWAGMVSRLENNPGDRGPDAAPASLVDYLAMRVTYDRYALRDVARRTLGYDGTLVGLADHVRRTRSEHHVESVQPDHDGPWRLFQLAQRAGASIADVAPLDAAARAEVLHWIDAFGDVARRRVWHEAYEHQHRDEVLIGIAQNRGRTPLERKTDARCQVLFCIDDREESFRRHLEELDPRNETFGVAGFFGVAIDYRGLDDGGTASLCPVVVTPAHEVHEEHAPADAHLASQRQRRRALFARLAFSVQSGSRSLVQGALLTPIIGLFTIIPFVARLLFPRFASKIREVAASWFIPEPTTRLSIHRSDERVPTPSDKARGFSVKERADRVAGTLENVGLTRGFAELVVLLGHGSISENNPHRSAYDCGACGGRHGGPNARLFAAMANDPEVRAMLRARGLDIPDGTHFVGGMHNTANDAIHLYDLDQVPPGHEAAVAALVQQFEKARRMSAHERCRRFASAPKDPTPERALRHVEARTADLGQARPELGHVTNAVAVVGRRALTRGLFMDRRAFLISYDPTLDRDGKILERVLLAVGPVGAGINLEYYFSCVDNERYGCGTKLPHNVTGLLGVMDGSLSDLRTGLPKQMIEIHEPVRLLMVLDATPEAILRVAENQPIVRELVVHQWVQLVSAHPDTGELRVFTPGGFVPFVPSSTAPLPRVNASRDWYRGKHDFVPPALIRLPEHPPWPAQPAARDAPTEHADAA